MPESVPEGVFAVRWPGNVAELELSAAPFTRAESEFASMDGLPVAILRGERTQLRVAGREIALPDGAGLPEERAALGEDPCFLGRAGTSRYLACFSAGDFSPMGAVVADDIEIEEGARVRALTRLHDTVGHARIEIWEAQGDALVQADAEHAWADGTPVWPRSAEDAARAALEAALLGLSDEAEGYLAPHLRGQSLVQTLAEGFDACVSLRYAIPDARSAVGLMRRETERCAAITPVYYEAVPMGGQQGAWAIASMTRGEDR